MGELSGQERVPGARFAVFTAPFDFSVVNSETYPGCSLMHTVEVAAIQAVGEGVSLKTSQ